MRLFIALNLPGYIKDYISAIKVPGRRAADYHITLKFLGEIENPEEIIKSLGAVSFNSFNLSLDSIGYFPDKRRPRVVWIGVKPWEDIISLQKEIQKAAPGSNSNFHPHITLSRLNAKVEIPKQDIKKLDFEVKSFELIRSTLTPQGPVYENVKTFINKS